MKKILSALCMISACCGCFGMDYDNIDEGSSRNSVNYDRMCHLVCGIENMLIA